MTYAGLCIQQSRAVPENSSGSEIWICWCILICLSSDDLRYGFVWGLFGDLDLSEIRIPLKLLCWAILRFSNMASWQVYHLWMVFPLKALSVGEFSATFDYHGGRHLGKDSQRGCARTLGLSQPFFPAGCLMKRKVNPHWRTNGYIVDHYLLINGMPNLSLYFPKGH